jgi:hypothetical protein
MIAGGIARRTPGFAALPLVLAVGLGPMLLGVAAVWSSRTLRALNTAMPAHWLVRAQTYRALGVMFLYPFAFYGVLPAGFALPAAIGDFITGAAAPFVASALVRRRRGAWALAVAWNLFGIADLIVAPASAVLSQARVVELWPLNLVPLFIGPPMGILVHILSLRNLAAEEARAPVPAAA